MDAHVIIVMALVRAYVPQIFKLIESFRFFGTAIAYVHCFRPHCGPYLVQACESHIVRQAIGRNLRKPVTLRTARGAIIKVPILVRLGHDSKGDLFHMASDMSAKLM
jgi:hypothetical protein